MWDSDTDVTLSDFEKMALTKTIRSNRKPAPSAKTTPAIGQLKKETITIKKELRFSQQDLDLLGACESGDLDLVNSFNSHQSQVYQKIWDKANVNCRKPVYGSS